MDFKNKTYFLSCLTVWIFIVCLGCVNCAPKKIKETTNGAGNSGKNDKKSTEPQVLYSGETTSPITWPWQVAIYTRQDGKHIFRCGGSLVALDTVITAAHCVRNPDSGAGDIKVIAGEKDRTNTDVGEQSRTVTTVVVHPDYTGTLSSLFINDIAMLKLSTPLAQTAHVQPLHTVGNNCSPAVLSTSMCIITGWGISSTKDKITSLSNMLSDTEVTVLTNDECNKKNNWDGLIKPSQMCAYNKKMSACMGDSGGPLVCKVDGSYVQCGLTSWGSKSCDQKPSVFTRLSAYISWIQTTQTDFNTPI